MIWVVYVPLCLISWFQQVCTCTFIGWLAKIKEKKYIQNIQNHTAKSDEWDLVCKKWMNIVQMEEVYIVVSWMKMDFMVVHEIQLWNVKLFHDYQVKIGDRATRTNLLFGWCAALDTVKKKRKCGSQERQKVIPWYFPRLDEKVSVFTFSAPRDAFFGVWCISCVVAFRDSV